MKILIRSFALGCYYKYTRYSSDGGGKVWYLDRHRMNCGSKSNVLAMFQLQRNPKGDKIRYRYKCCRRFCTLKHKTTPFKSDLGGNAKALSYHIATCGLYGFVNDIRVRRNAAGNKIRYEYFCCPASRRKYYYGSTRRTTSGHGNAVFLDRQRVSCARGYALSYYWLIESKGKWYYNYRCCKLT